jgi:hypothetical protein
MSESRGYRVVLVSGYRRRAYTMWVDKAFATRLAAHYASKRDTSVWRFAVESKRGALYEVSA